MLSRNSIISLINEFWSDDSEIAGKENIKNIVEDVLLGSNVSENYALPPTGHHFDITIDLAIILSAAQLIVAIVQLIISLKESNKEDSKQIIKSKIVTMNYKALETIEDKEVEVLIETVMKYYQNEK